MVDGKLFARVRIDARPPARERYLAARRRRYWRRMELAGIRPASIQRYLARGFPGPWARARTAEMQRVIWDLKYRPRARR